MSPSSRRLHPSLVHHVVNTLGWPDLRPLQQAAIEPLRAGDDALLLAATAAGKTEAAAFPLLSRMADEAWPAPSVLYVCPLKALLNNLLPRLETYAGWAGRRVALWHGDVGASRRARLLRDPPDLLLTTPESIEAMLVSTKVDHRRLFASVRSVVVDEVHAFAGDDRGWHLLSLLERLGHLAERPLQRIGLSATVGNPEELLSWLQGSGMGSRPARVVSAAQSHSRPASAVESAPKPHSPTTDADQPGALPPQHDQPAADVQLDYVGSVSNAATVIAALHRGEKRLVFCDSKKIVEELGEQLRGRGVTTFLSHASLSADERRRAEEAFAAARDCVIVATSTLELGVDVGDLDRVVQINAPASVSSFLQRLGRTGRRHRTEPNCLFLALTETALLHAAGLLRLWSQGYVEPVTAPPEPRHIVAQQLLALCLQEGQVGEHLWQEWWHGLAPFGAQVEPVAAYLRDHGFVDRDGGLVFIGSEAERRFGRRNFMELTTAFTASPEFTVLSGRTEIGRSDPALLVEPAEGPRVLLLAGQSWRVTWVDWHRRHCFVEPADSGGRARWNAGSGSGLSFPVSRAMREVLLGSGVPATLTRRADEALAALRDDLGDTVSVGETLITRGTRGDVRWWTWAGYRANATLKTTLGEDAGRPQRVSDTYLRLRDDLDPEAWTAARRQAREHLCLPHVDERALEGLKFSAALPRHLAEATLAARAADLDGAAAVLEQRTRFSG